MPRLTEQEKYAINAVANRDPATSAILLYTVQQPYDPAIDTDFHDDFEYDLLPRYDFNRWFHLTGRGQRLRRWRECRKRRAAAAIASRPEFV